MLFKLARVNTPHSSCRLICKEYKAIKSHSGSRYEEGQKRCQLCVLFLKWEGNWCPCCGYRLRNKPRAGQYKEKLQKLKSIV